MKYDTNIDKKIIDGMVYCSEIDKWVDANEYLYHHCIKVAKDEQAKELQQKIANLYELDKLIDGLAEKNGITNY
jgi:hypothetical protein|tara:strand:+ start:308 stop:529 length:222 start_codon:yes stop_codon:yes gene_type:complete